MLLSNKIILITGGTGSLGTAIINSIATGKYGKPRAVIVFSRDELKQAQMAQDYIDYRWLYFVIGDVRHYGSIKNAIRSVDIVIHAAAMKRVEMCERFPDEAVLTNYMGASNIVQAIKDTSASIECVVGVSSDKGAKPLNVYGMTKALQESRLIAANNEDIGHTKFVCVRYGNVVGSRGSVIPIWQQLIKEGKSITVTDPKMTRFFVSLDTAVDTIMSVIKDGQPGDIYVPSKLPAATIGDLANVLTNGNSKNIIVTGKGRGEKMHETLVTDDEISRTVKRDGYYVITTEQQQYHELDREYISRDYVLSPHDLYKVMREYGVIQ